MDQDQANQIISRLNSIEKHQQIFHEDREILESISIRLGKVEDEIKYLKEKVVKLDKNISADIAEMSDKTVEIKESIEQLGAVE